MKGALTPGRAGWIRKEAVKRGRSRFSISAGGDRRRSRRRVFKDVPFSTAAIPSSTIPLLLTRCIHDSHSRVLSSAPSLHFCSWTVLDILSRDDHNLQAGTGLDTPPKSSSARPLGYLLT